jgi:GPH family glycoside/pentoside/hexuronide:cation symporter
LPDVIDLDQLQSGQRREGIFYGLMNQFQKLGLAIALFLIGKTLNWAGFISRNVEQAALSQPDTALWAIRLLFSLVPALILGLGLILAYFYPISREAHAAIREELRSR